MPIAYVMINTEVGTMEKVHEAIKKINGVTEAYMVYGIYDIIAKINAETMERLKEIVTWDIRRLESVRSTITMVVIEG